MKRLGILGGTFDPVHLGHLVMAQAALKEMKLDKVFFVPCRLPPHKPASNLTPASDRLAMIRLAIQSNKDFAVSDFEIKRRGKSYSIDTVKYFKKAYSHSKLFFIIGGDALAGLPQWKNIGGILKIVEFVVVNRPGNFFPKKAIKHHTVLMPGIDLSSSYIRANLRKNKTVRYLVPDGVIEYIERRKLYR